MIYQVLLWGMAALGAATLWLLLTAPRPMPVPVGDKGVPRE